MNQPAPIAPLNVLLLDDDAFMLEVVADMFSELGFFTLHCETDARRALLHLAAQPPAVLVCDLSMPDMDGIEFLNAAAEAGFKGGVILLTGMDAGVRRSAERLARAHGLNVLGSHKKPITPAELRAALTRLACPSGVPGGNVYNVTTHSGK
ncbi:MAG: response regulator [Pseudomonadota bacterium]